MNDNEESVSMYEYSTKKRIWYNDTSHYSAVIEGDLAVKCHQCDKLIVFKTAFKAKANLEASPRRFGTDPVEVNVRRSIQCPHCGAYGEYINGERPQIIMINDLLNVKGYESIIPKSRYEFCCDQILSINVSDPNVRSIIEETCLPCDEWPFMIRMDAVRWTFATIFARVESDGNIDLDALMSLYQWVEQLPNLKNTSEEDNDEQ